MFTQYRNSGTPCSHAPRPCGFATTTLLRRRSEKAGLDLPCPDDLDHAMARLVPDPVQLALGLFALSPVMADILDVARRVARVDSTLLITGETGSGKEQVARFIHEKSPRAAGPFVAFNCGAISEGLFESELFGHARGAFSGATQDRPGLFEAANHGTILLDEIGEISLAMQVKLLRAIQEREIRRMGETRTRPIDVRIMAATNRTLASEVEKGGFRQDLYYRLKVVELAVPALRERREDLLPLALFLLAGRALAMGRKIKGITSLAARGLVRYPWPGNVRELANAMERSIALGVTDRVEYEDLPEEIRSAADAARSQEGPPPEAVRPLSESMKDCILAALAYHGGNQLRTAEQLQIGTATLYRKLKSYGSIVNERTARTPPLAAADLPSAS